MATTSQRVLDLVAAIAADIKSLSARTSSSSVLTLFNSGDNSEKVATLPITVSVATKVVVYSVEITDLAIGDQLVVTGDMQVTNDDTFNVLCAQQIILADSATNTLGTEVSEASGTNVTPANHHMVFSKTGTITVTSTARRFVNFVAYAVASQAQTDDTMTVDADYGRLMVQRYRTVSNASSSTVISNKADRSELGDLTSLTTTIKTSVVNAINELVTKIDAKAASVHTHSAADITTGFINIARVAPGTKVVVVRNAAAGTWLFNGAIITARPGNRTDILIEFNGGADADRPAWGNQPGDTHNVTVTS